MKTITRFEGLQGIKLIRTLMQKLILLEFSHEIQTNLEGEYPSQSEVTCSVLTGTHFWAVMILRTSKTNCCITSRNVKYYSANKMKKLGCLKLCRHY